MNKVYLCMDRDLLESNAAKTAKASFPEHLMLYSSTPTFELPDLYFGFFSASSSITSSGPAATLNMALPSPLRSRPLRDFFP